MTNKMATREAYGKALELFGGDERIVVLDADLSKSTKTEFFKKKYPERFFNIGIAESNMMSIAAGMASCGKVVFASTFAMFAAGRAFEQIRNSICYPMLNVKIGASHAGITVGEDGASHQSVEDIALMNVIPNMVVFSPSDSIETTNIVKYSIEHNGPVYIRLSRMSVSDIFDENYKFEFGKGITIKDGDDITIISTGVMTHNAIEALAILKKHKISARLINIHTIKPIDKDIVIKAAKETKVIVTVEEHSVIGGLGSIVSSVLSEHCPVPLKMVGIKDKFGKSGTPEELIKKYKLTSDDIADAVLEVFKNKK